jgi:hypothetical protein
LQKFLNPLCSGQGPVHIFFIDFYFHGIPGLYPVSG